MRKRMISLLLTAVLLFSVAIPVSAQSVEKNGTYNGCSYFILANCTESYYSSLMEYMYSDTGDYDDYMLQVIANVYTYDLVHDTYQYHYQASRANYRIANLPGRTISNEYIVHGNFEYRINGSVADTITNVLPY